jgi:uncharacterized protein YgbK (DUF1537 family)
MERLILADVLRKYKAVDSENINDLLLGEIQNNKQKIVVLDDDPTGIQTVNGISVYTDWSIDSLREGFSEENKMFYILTNSRGLTAQETYKLHEQIALTVLTVSREQDKEFIIVSRGDSTLRGHYPLETKILKDTIEQNSKSVIDGEIIIPFFKEGGRYTIENIHYVAEGEYLTPAGETEFANDKTFGYTSSHLGQWIEEKSSGKYKKENTVYISLEDIRNLNIEGITNQLLQVNNFGKVVVNALEYNDLKVFCTALYRVIRGGKQFLFRTAAAFVKVFGGVKDKGLLRREDLIKIDSKKGGIIIAASHTKRTTEQLAELRSCGFVTLIEFNQHLVLNPPLLEREVTRVVEKCEAYISQGKTVVVYTKRERIDLNAVDKEEELKLSVRISDSVTSIVEKLSVSPNFILAKGGITSSDIGVKGLKVKKAVALGQISPGIPVWRLGEESKFPDMPYVIFPGNVGNKSSLKEAVEILEGM